MLLENREQVAGAMSQGCLQLGLSLLEIELHVRLPVQLGRL
jgi:hypothetical protein